MGSFYVTAGKELPPLIAEATTSLRVRSGGVVKQLPWEDLRALATLQVERTLLCDGAGFEIRSLGAPDHTLLHWNWRFAAIGNARWDCIPLDRLFDALGLPLKGPFVRAAARDTEDWFYPIETVRRGEILVAVGMNGAPLTHEHGAPARLVASGQYGQSSLKWIVELSAGIEAYPTRDYEFAGNHVHQVKPFVFASSPRSGSKVGRTVVLDGAAYAGATPVTEVIIINERAQQRHRARFIDPPQPFVWSRWRAEIPVLKGDSVSPSAARTPWDDTPKSAADDCPASPMAGTAFRCWRSSAGKLRLAPSPEVAMHQRRALTTTW